MTKEVKEQMDRSATLRAQNRPRTPIEPHEVRSICALGGVEYCVSHTHLWRLVDDQNSIATCGADPRSPHFSGGDPPFKAVGSQRFHFCSSYFYVFTLGSSAEQVKR